MDIVERLRACAECEQAPLGPLLADAADEIERLRAESKALALGHPNIANAEILRRMEAAEAERYRLRELLREARFMWVDDHSNLANRIDAALKESHE